MNVAGMNFCIRCGNRLSTVCQNCDAQVPPDSRFCPNCASLVGTGRFGKYLEKVDSTDYLITCADCGTANKSGRRFCTACGARLLITCTVCNNSNVLPSGYCPDCGNIIKNTGGS